MDEGPRVKTKSDHAGGEIRSMRMHERDERSGEETKPVTSRTSRWSLAGAIKYMGDAFAGTISRFKRPWFQFLEGFHYAGFQRSRQIDSLKKAIDNGNRVVELTPDGHPNLPLQLNNLGMYYRARFLSLGELDDIETAIAHLTHALALTPDNHAFQANIINNLGLLYLGRFEHLGALDDLEKAVEHGIRAVDLTPDGHPDLPMRLVSLGLFYRTRFQRQGELEDIQKAVAHISHAVELTPDSHPSLPLWFSNLGISYSIRFGRLGSFDNLEKAIEYGTRAVNMTPNGHPDLPMILNNIGLSYRSRFLCQGDLNDLEQAIAHISRAVALTPIRHPSLPSWLSNLGISYSNRFDRLNGFDDLEKAIEYGARAVDQTPVGNPFVPLRLSNLGVSYHARFLRQGELHDLEQAIANTSRAVILTPNDHPSLPLWLSNLGQSYLERFKRLDTPEDLEKAIEYGTRAVDLTPDGHTDLPVRLNNLGLAYHARFQRRGDLDDLENTIPLMDRVIALTPKGHSSLPLWLSNLGFLYSNRFDRLGNFGDLEKAIEYGTRAVDQTPDDHPDLPTRLTNIGIAYYARFQHRGDPADFERTISLMTRAVVMTPDDHPSLPRCLSNLGRCYSDQFDLLGNLSDLEKAIEYGTRGLSMTPVGHPDLLIILNNLGTFHHARFLHLGDLEDLEQSVDHLSHALQWAPNDHPKLSTTYQRLGTTNLSRHQRTGNPSHLQESLGSFRKASRLPTGSPRERFRYALAWAGFAVSHSGLNCMEAYRTAVELLPHFIWLGATTTQRYRDLKTVENLAINAALAAILLFDPASGLEWLEHARGVVWSQSLMLRSPLEQLYSSHSELAGRLRMVAEQLHDAASDSEISELQTLPSGSDSPEQVGRNRRRLANEYDRLLAEARALPGFAEFLHPMKANEFVRAARNGPVVVINCHDDRCDALIISPGRENIAHLPLLDYNQKKAQNARSKLEISLGRNGSRQRGVKMMLPQGHQDGFPNMLLELWRHIVKPVLDYLGFNNHDLPIDSLPHITWCPTGAMTFLPLHAAGDYKQPQSCVFDYVVSSYTPTLTALLASTSNIPTNSPRVLAISQTNTPGQNPLPGTAEELECVKDRLQNKAEYAQLTNSQATVEAVLDGMEQHDWVHLACHAHQNVQEPTKSGFFLHNGTLDLASINRRSFKNKGLAFLSACQTATGDEALPDEAIHLASGMLMAGYPSVIATMWAVMDDDAPFIADKVYAELMKEGKVGNGEAGRALHLAAAALREKVGVKEFGRWVPYVHIGS